jgi:hypothetical protein
MSIIGAVTSGDHLHLGNGIAFLNPCPARKSQNHQVAICVLGFCPRKMISQKYGNRRCIEYSNPVSKKAHIGRNTCKNNICVHFMRSSSPVCFHSVHR